MKQLFCIFLLLFAITCNAQTQGVTVTGDSNNTVVQRGPFGSLYGAIIPVHDTALIPLVKRYAGLTVVQPGSFDLWSWISASWVPISGSGSGGSNIANSDLLSDADHNWNVNNKNQGIFGFASMYFSATGAPVPAIQMIPGQTVIASGAGANVDVVATSITINGNTRGLIVKGQLRTTSGERSKIDTANANITLDSTYHFITISAALASDTVFLPPVASVYDVSTNTGIHYTIKRVDTAFLHTVFVKAAGSELIDGTGTKQLGLLGSAMGDHTSVFTNGVSWFTY